MCAPSFLQQAGKPEEEGAVISAEKAGAPPSRTTRRIEAKRRITTMRLQEPLAVGNGHDNRPPTRIGRESGLPNRCRRRRSRNEQKHFVVISLWEKFGNSVHAAAHVVTFTRYYIFAQFS